jgi:divalent metal cation (Fe/Co/Zn/Cd) transporter
MSVHAHAHDGGHGHSHGLVSASIKRSQAGLRAVALTLVVLLVTAAAQAAVFVAMSSVALLADLIHNFGDALTAVPLAVAFVMRSFVAEKRAGYFVVATIFVSACVALVESVNRLVNPQALSHLWRSPRPG